MKRKLFAALLCLCASFGMMTAVAMADDTHSHSCSASCNHVVGDPHKRSSLVWTEWTTDNALPTDNGNYYLTTTVTLEGDCPNLWEKNIVLCLNGHNINLNGKYIKVRGSRTPSTLELTDCGNGEIRGGVNSEEPTTSDRELGHGGAVSIEDGTFSLYAGNIANNQALYGGAVACIYEDSKFNMYGGTISGNFASEGGGVYIRKGKFDLQGGKIESNSAAYDGGGIFVSNSADDETTFYLSKNPSIQSNNNNTLASPSQSDTTQVYLYDRAVITLKGALTYTTPIDVHTHYTNGGLLVEDWLPAMNGKKPSSYFKSTRSDLPYIVVRGLNLETAATNPKPTPNATFTATGDSYGNLSGVTAGMKYEIHYESGHVSNFNISGTTVSLSGLEPCEIWVINPGDNTEYTDSEPQKIQVTKAEAPTGLSTSPCTTLGGNDGKITDVTTGMEYRKADVTDYIACTGTEIPGIEDGE